MTITQLRKNGQLDEAIIKAEDALMKAPESITSRSDLAWVLYDLLKKYNNPEYSADFINILNKVSCLKLNDCVLFYNLCLKQVNWHLNQLSAQADINPKHWSGILEKVMKIKWDRNDQSYSRLLLYALRNKSFEGLGKFIYWWNLKNLKASDYQSYQPENGKKIISLAERAYLTLARIFLQQSEQYTPDEFTHMTKRLLQLTNEYRDYKHLKGILVKFYIRNADWQEAREMLIDILQMNLRDSNYWYMLASTFTKIEELKMQCLIRALKANPAQKDEFLVRIREELAELSIEKQSFSLAKLLVANIIETRNKNGWPLSGKIQKWQESDWFQEEYSPEAEVELFKQSMVRTNELIFPGFTEKIAVITNVNPQKNLAYFNLDRESSGIVPSYLFSKALKPGQLVRMILDMQKDRIKIKAIAPALKEDSLPVVKNFHGRVEMNNKFGMVNDVFLPLTLVRDVESGEEIKGTAIENYDQKRRRWGWRALTAEKITANGHLS